LARHWQRRGRYPAIDSYDLRDQNTAVPRWKGVNFAQIHDNCVDPSYGKEAVHLGADVQG
jgi:hypothetical protein